MEKQTIQYRLVKRLTSIVAESMTRGLVTIAAIAGLVCGLVEGGCTALLESQIHFIVKYSI